MRLCFSATSGGGGGWHSRKRHVFRIDKFGGDRKKAGRGSPYRTSSSRRSYVAEVSCPRVFFFFPFPFHSHRLYGLSCSKTTLLSHSPARQAMLYNNDLTPSTITQSHVFHTTATCRLSSRLTSSSNRVGRERERERELSARLIGPGEQESHETWGFLNVRALRLVCVLRLQD